MSHIKENKQLLGHLLAIFCCLVWGTTFVSSKVLLRSFTPVELLLNRFILGYLTLWILQPKRLKYVDFKQELLFAGAGFSGVTLYYLFENMALTHTQAANVSVIVSTAPLFVSILAFFYIKEEKLQKYFIPGFVVAMIGIILLSFGGGSQVKFSPAGDGLCVLAAILWGVYSIFVKKINALGYSIILTTRRIFFYGILCMIPFAVGMGYQIKIEQIFHMINILNLLFLGIVACALCFISWNKAVDLLGAIKTSAYIYAIPVITLVASMIVLDEKVTFLMAVGTVLTVLGLIISEKK